MPNLNQAAPPFKLKSNKDKEFALSDYLGQKHVVLVFYPLDFSPVCSNQLPEYSSREEDIEAAGAVILGINRDSVYTHKAFQAFGITIPLLADLNGAVAKSYEVYLDHLGMSTRAVFIIDKEGMLRFKHVEATPGQFTLRWLIC
ncbi:MAG: redoxin domain-containing protein [Deinococcales bacterium]